MTSYSEGYLYVNGKYELVERQEIKPSEWMVETDDMYAKDDLNNNIQAIDFIRLNPDQDLRLENQKIINFLNLFKTKLAIDNNTTPDEIEIEFINHGNNELVYILTINGNEKFALLVKQPHIPYGALKQEADNLNRLNKISEHVIAAVDYFTYSDLELFVTPYIDNIRSISGGDFTWGTYKTEPIFCFTEFSAHQKRIVTTCMIALLVSLYDFDKLCGISACKLSRGDFILTEGWDIEKTSVANTLENLYLTAARDTINVSFVEYLNIIREEFAKITINTPALVNVDGRSPINSEDIEQGIKLGIEIIHKRNGDTVRTRA